MSESYPLVLLEEQSTHVTNIDKGSLVDADMAVNLDKTKSMHIERQQKLKPPTQEAIKAAEAEYKHACEFCDRKFKTVRGLVKNTLSLLQFSTWINR